uniref:Lipase maturation factor n=1 Tax=Panagrellus redivivus TaxID=6233 RepID=A0A7E4UW77_PANRE
MVPAPDDDLMFHRIIPTFTLDHRVLITAGPELAMRRDIPACLWTEIHGPQRCYQIGWNAMFARPFYPTFIIYDFPGLIACEEDPNVENPPWNFVTHRDDDLLLLVRIGQGHTERPIILFAEYLVRLHAKIASHHDGIVHEVEDCWHHS